MDEIVRDFLIESREGLDKLDRVFIELEQNPGDQGRLNDIFRSIHSVKGTCGFLGFPKLEATAHAGESLLSRLRDGTLQLDTEITSALLALVDAIRTMMAAIESNDGLAEGDLQTDALIARLQGLTRADAPAPAPPPPIAPAAPAPIVPAAVAPAPPPSAAPPPSPVPEHHPVEGGLADASIRVDVGILDDLMNLVGELVLARNQVQQASARQADSVMTTSMQRLNMIVTELQESVMKTRMQPIGTVWSKFPRIARDLSLALAKQIRIEMEGKETELDKTIIEAIKDPLIHIIRNAIDHGLETPADRVATGKPPEGVLSLRAFHGGGQVHIEISDDGRGIDSAKVIAKALQRGLISPDVATRMSEREAIALIFLPGFSTAEHVTNVSGRGVGMDVVRSNIERIGGTVEVLSRAGRGSTVKIKIPLTLAIIPALLITNAGDRFALPQGSLLELVRLEGAAARRGIESIQGAPVYRLRGKLLPLVTLSEALGVTPTTYNGPEEDLVVNIVVVEADGKPFGLIVDTINDTEEIVVKPLGQHLKGLDVYAGATIMGDGRVALILDVAGLGRKSGALAPGRARGNAEAAAQPQRERRAMLLFTVGETRRVAIPLTTVTRLEELPRSHVETAGGSEVIQYRGRLLPLLQVSKLLGAPPKPVVESDPVQIIVYSDGRSSVGLVVDQIVDIIEDSFVIHRAREKGVIAGSVVIQEKVTDILDIAGAIAAARITLYEDRVEP